MKTVYLSILFILGLTLSSCHRDDQDLGPVETFTAHQPETILDSTVTSYFRASSDEYLLVNGTGSVEKGLEKKYFVEVVLKVFESDQPFLMGWEQDELVSGVFDGEWFSMTLDDVNEISGGPLLAGSFKVTVLEFGEIGHTITGTYSGLGLKTGVADLVEFSGAFNVTRKQ
jgi:hypothetical protein